MGGLAGFMAARGRPSKGILHLGANKAQEAVGYLNLDPDYIVWVEAIPAYAARCKKVSHRAAVETGNTRTRSIVINAAVMERDVPEVDFFLYNNGASSSLFHFTEQFAKVSRRVQETGEVIKVPGRSVDSLLEEHGLLGRIDTMVLDLQGAELKALHGSHEAIKSVMTIEVETAIEPMYEGGVLLPELDAYLQCLGFSLAPEQTGKRNPDAIYLRN
jgi:FkbM family methyltransferase